jgi:hypothetical protein
MNDEICYLSLCGMLGYGYASESLANAFRGQLDFIGVDAGSTDPGPYYLGSGKGFVKPLLVKRDLSLVLKPALDRKIPLIIGSAGGSGARPHVFSPVVARVLLMFPASATCAIRLPSSARIQLLMLLIQVRMSF